MFLLDKTKISKVFPSYFKNFDLPKEAKEQSIEVYRACSTRKIDRESFLNSYEQNGFNIEQGGDPNDPSQYSLSTYFRLKDIKRFVIINSRFQPPCTLAKGFTDPNCGVSCKTSEYKPRKDSHVDWWLYEDSTPWMSFMEVDYEEERNRISSGK